MARATLRETRTPTSILSPAELSPLPGFEPRGPFSYQPLNRRGKPGITEGESKPIVARRYGQGDARARARAIPNQFLPAEDAWMPSRPPTYSLRGEEGGRAAFDKTEKAAGAPRGAGGGRATSILSIAHAHTHTKTGDQRRGNGASAATKCRIHRATTIHVTKIMS